MFLSQDVAKDRYLETQLLGGKSNEREMNVSQRADLYNNSRCYLTRYPLGSHSRSAAKVHEDLVADGLLLP